MWLLVINCVYTFNNYKINNKYIDNNSIWQINTSNLFIFICNSNSPEVYRAIPFKHFFFFFAIYLTCCHINGSMTLFELDIVLYITQFFFFHTNKICITRRMGSFVSKVCSIEINHFTFLPEIKPVFRVFVLIQLCLFIRLSFFFLLLLFNLNFTFIFALKIFFYMSFDNLQTLYDKMF